MFKRVHLYIFRELIPPFLVTILVLTLVMILGRIMQLMNLIVNRGVSLGDVLRLVVSILPSLWAFILPIACLMAVLTSFLRLSNDNEVTAMKNAGMSLYQILPPVAAFALLVYGGTLLMSIYALPNGQRQARLTVAGIVRRHAEVALKEGVFNEVMKKVVLYMGRYVPQERRMEQVLISDERDPDIQNTIVAREGYVLEHSDGRGICFRIYDGVITRVEPGMESAQTVTFDRYDLNVRLPEAPSLYDLGSEPSTRVWEMSQSQLRQVARASPLGSERRQMALMEYHQRLALPLACLVMALLGVCLGVQVSGSRTMWGMVIGLLIFFVYFVLMSATRSLGEGDNVPVVAGTWTPNVLFTALGAYMLVQSAREHKLEVVQRIQYTLSSLFKKWHMDA